MDAAAERYCVGIDVAKRHWDVAVDGRSGVRRFTADAAGLAGLLSFLDTNGPAFVCLEATGGYERMLRETLHKRGIPVSVVNPRQIRDFAKALGQLAKTDAIDAAMIARFAATLEPEPNDPLSPSQERLRALRARRQQVVQSLTQEKNRLGTAPDAETRQSIQDAIDFYDRQLNDLNERIAQLTRTDPEFRRWICWLLCQASARSPPRGCWPSCPSLAL
jgi:transposase